MALAYSVRDRLLARWESSARTYGQRDVKVACYLSAEFLIGPQLGNNLVNLGIQANAREAMAALHSRPLQQTVLQDFAELWPKRFCNVTNGVTPRRFVMLSNPAIAQLLDETLGEGWVTDLSRLKAIEARADDRAFQEKWRRIKRTNKERLARHIRERTGVLIDPAALFDVQVKRIHEYKRQHLNALHIIRLYNRLRDNPRLDVPARCCIFGGKAAPGYAMAKLDQRRGRGREQ